MTMQRFTDLVEAAGQLADILPDDVIGEGDLIVGLGEPAIPIADVVAMRMGTHANLLPVLRGEEPVIGEVPQCAGRSVLVVDRGVETGGSAVLAAQALRAAGATRLVLAVPVCPRQSEAQLARIFDEIIAVQRPLARRSLQWHYLAPLE